MDRTDGGGISIINSLVTLKNLMEEIGPNAKPCDYFDMIAGSETGGLVAMPHFPPIHFLKIGLFPLAESSH
jgi:hypothetical protein